MNTVSGSAVRGRTTDADIPHDSDHAADGALIGALHGGARHPGIPAASAIYDWLIGSWDLDVMDHPEGQEPRSTTGECHFGRVLEGRGIQDVWIMPPRHARTTGPDAPGNRYGTTLRVYDRNADVWRITWINAVTLVEERLTGRRTGDDIVQAGTRADGSWIRWSFTDIAPDAFTWLGERSTDGGATWQLEAEFRARRRQTPA